MFCRQQVASQISRELSYLTVYRIHLAMFVRTITDKLTLMMMTAATASYPENATPINTVSCFTIDAVDYQSLAQRPLLPWFRCHRRHDHFRIDVCPERLAPISQWCNVSLTAIAAVACGRQICTFLKRSKFLKPQREIARKSHYHTRSTTHNT